MEKSGTMSICSSSARNVSSSGVRVGWSVFGSAMRWTWGFAVMSWSEKSCRLDASFEIQTRSDSAGK